VTECDRSWREGASTKTSITSDDSALCTGPLFDGRRAEVLTCGRMPMDRMLNCGRAADKRAKVQNPSRQSRTPHG
jgi:hypothetical protein